ncbi:MAG: hypothetical protein J6P90_05610 [Rikenellaceae bacterium]|nr:hypothetical protein [Rikenellaceae bacterium]
MQLKKCLILALSMLLFTACIREEFDSVQKSQSVVVGFCADGSIRTRTEINDDGKSTAWSPSDKIALWAKNESTQTYTLNNTAFSVYFRDTSTSAFFTTTLGEAMPDASYTYYATYPTPVSVSGTTATFIAPASQDGKMGGGAAIMVATPQSGKGALDIVTDREASDEVMDSNLHLGMTHKMHALRMFIPDIDTKRYYGFGEEKVQRIELTMPWDIAGTVSTDFVNPAAGITLTGNGSRTITLNLEEPIGATTANGNSYDYDYAYASIIPAPAGDASIYNGVLEAKVFTSTKAALASISLANLAESHQFLAGHITPVILNCSNTLQRYALRFKMGANNLGEDIHTIYFYDSAGNHLYTIEDVNNNMIIPGYHELDYTFATADEQNAYFALAGQTLTVKYESEHAIVSNTFVMPAINTPGCKEVVLNVPYLLFQDFSGVSALSSNDNYASGFLSGTKDGVLFLDGWSGGRIGASAGTAIRIACRRETSADYPARVDTPALSGLKAGASVTVSLSFNYSMARQEGGLQITPPSLGQTCYLGKTTTTGAIKSGRNFYTEGLDGQDGTFPTSFYINDTEGSYTNINNSYTYNMEGCGSTTRLTWLTTNDHKAGTNNGTYWLYIDNVKVQIVSE